MHTVVLWLYCAHRRLDTVRSAVLGSFGAIRGLPATCLALIGSPSLRNWIGRSSTLANALLYVLQEQHTATSEALVRGMTCKARLSCPKVLVFRPTCNGYCAHCLATTLDISTATYFTPPWVDWSFMCKHAHHLCQQHMWTKHRATACAPFKAPELSTISFVSAIAGITLVLVPGFGMRVHHCCEHVLQVVQQDSSNIGTST